MQFGEEKNYKYKKDLTCLVSETIYFFSHIIVFVRVYLMYIISYEFMMLGKHNGIL